MNYLSLNRYAFGLHGYHNSGGSFDVGDPLGLNKSVAGPTKGKALSQIGAGPFYNPPDVPKTPEQLAQEDEARKSALRDSINKLYGVGDDAAAKQLKSETDQLSGETRDFYNDQLSRQAAAAERSNRFKLARQGLSGGSVDVDTNAELETNKNIGATRVDTAARQAAAQLTAQREAERLGAISLVDSGVGSDAVGAAATGLKQSLSNAQAQQKTDITSDLFSNFADAYTAGNLNGANAAMLARYNQSLAKFFPTSAKTTSGAVTPSA